MQSEERSRLTIDWLHGVRRNAVVSLSPLARAGTFCAPKGSLISVVAEGGKVRGEANRSFAPRNRWHSHCPRADSAESLDSIFWRRATPVRSASENAPVAFSESK